MSGTEPCPCCKEGCIEEDSVGAENNKICTNCGYVIEATTLHSPTFLEGYSSSNAGCFEKKYKVKVDNGGKPRRSSMQLAILQKIKIYTEKFPNAEDLYNTTSAMFFRSIEGKRYLSHEKTKTTLSAACLVLVLRQNGHPVQTAQVCKELGVDGKGLSTLLGEIQQQERIEYPSLHIEDIVDGIFREFIAIRDRQPLKKVVVQLCKLFEDLHLSPSHPRQLVAMCALYYSLISENPTSRLPQSFKSFCKEYKMACHPSVMNFSKCARERLVLLAKRLPWVQQPVTMKNVRFHIRDILKMKNALLSRDASTEGAIQPQKRTRTSSEVTITEQMALEMPPSAIRSLVCKKPKLADQQEPAEVSNSETITEDEIGEEEMKQYIRTPEEVLIQHKINKLISTNERPHCE